ncbi:MAG TPA: GTP-binding protein [Solirubrobacteraceae bacterium]|nr:GTP-binding protein [Solirubrobacteraceae bacterium]
MVDFLRFATAGSVDDGKSTLIGRLLHDAKVVLADQLEHVEATSRRRGDGHVDLSLLTDGLRAEREQGITIDVAYRPFATPRRRFLIADCPGHAQYTRNMVTGASTAELALILIDARQGMTEQSRRHAAIARLLGVGQVTVCVNKMDLVDWSEDAFDGVVRDFLDWSARLDLHGVTFIPICALHGDNVVQRSGRMAWYGGEPLLAHLETVPRAQSLAERPVRLPVQWVIRPHPTERPDERLYAGQIAGGTLRPGDEVVVLPSGARSRIARIDGADGEQREARAPMSVAVALADDLDAGRGDLLAAPEAPPVAVRELSATVCWLGEQPARPGARYLLKHTTRTVPARLEAIEHRLDVQTLERSPADALALNDIARVLLRTGAELLVDPYLESRATGALILVDPATNDTVGAGMVA